MLRQSSTTGITRAWSIITKSWSSYLTRHCPSTTPSLPVVTGGAKRTFHVSPASLKRNDSKARRYRRVKNWKKHQSERSKEKFLTRLHQDAERSRRSTMALERVNAAKAKALAIDQMKLRTEEADAELAVSTIDMKYNPPPTPKNELLQVNPDTFQKAITNGRIEKNAQNFVYLMRIRGAHGDIEGALGVLEMMREEGIEPNTRALNALMTACSNQGNYVAARQVLGSMEHYGVAPDRASYGSLMQSYIQAGHLAEAFGVLQEAQAAGIRPDAVLFTHLIVGCIHYGKFEKAWETFDHMRTYVCEPDEVTFTAMINACARCDEVERALNLYTEMVQLKMQPTHVTFNALMYACGRSMRFSDKAHDIFEEMDAAGFMQDTYSYNAVLLACSHEGKFNLAKDYMRRMAQNRIKPDIITYNTLLLCYARACEALNVRDKHTNLITLGSTEHPEEVVTSMFQRRLLHDPDIVEREGNVEAVREARVGSGKVWVDPLDEDDTVDRLLLDLNFRKTTTLPDANDEEVYQTLQGVKKPERFMIGQPTAIDSFEAPGYGLKAGEKEHIKQAQTWDSDNELDPSPTLLEDLERVGAITPHERASLEKQQLENEAAMDRAEEKAAFGASLAIESVLHHTKQAWEADEAARQQDALGAEASDAEGVQEGELAGLTAPRVAPGGTPEVVDLPTGGTGGDFNPKSVPVPFTFGSTLRTLGIPEDEIQRALQKKKDGYDLNSFASFDRLRASEREVLRDTLRATFGKYVKGFSKEEVEQLQNNFLKQAQDAEKLWYDLEKKRGIYHSETKPLSFGDNPSKFSIVDEVADVLREIHGIQQFGQAMQAMDSKQSALAENESKGDASALEPASTSNAVTKTSLNDVLKQIKAAKTPKETHEIIQHTLKGLEVADGDFLAMEIRDALELQLVALAHENDPESKGSSSLALAGSDSLLKEVKGLAGSLQQLEGDFQALTTVEGQSRAVQAMMDAVGMGEWDTDAELAEMEATLNFKETEIEDDQVANNLRQHASRFASERILRTVEERFGTLNFGDVLPELPEELVNAFNIHELAKETDLANTLSLQHQFAGMLKAYITRINQQAEEVVLGKTSEPLLPTLPTVIPKISPKTVRGATPTPGPHRQMLFDDETLTLEGEVRVTPQDKVPREVSSADAAVAKDSMRSQLQQLLLQLVDKGRKAEPSTGEGATAVSAASTNPPRTRKARPASWQSVAAAASASYEDGVEDGYAGDSDVEDEDLTGEVVGPGEVQPGYVRRRRRGKPDPHKSVEALRRLQRQRQQEQEQQEQEEEAHQHVPFPHDDASGEDEAFSAMPTAGTPLHSTFGQQNQAQPMDLPSHKDLATMDTGSLVDMMESQQYLEGGLNSTTGAAPAPTSTPSKPSDTQTWDTIRRDEIGKDYEPGWDEAKDEGVAGIRPLRLKKTTTVPVNSTPETRKSLLETVVEATEDTQGRRRRMWEGKKPSLLEAIFGVRKLEESYMKEGEEPATALSPFESWKALERGGLASHIFSHEKGLAMLPGSSSGPSSTQGGDGTAAPPTTLGRARSSATANTLAHGLSMPTEANVNARAKLANLIRPGTQGEVQLKALQKLSQRVLAGARWLPTELPNEPQMAAGVLLDEMHYVLDDAERQGLRPDAYTLNTFVLAYAALLDTESVTRLVQEWFPRYGYQPDVRTYRAIIRMYVNAKDNESALATLRDIEAKGLVPDKDCYGWMIHGFAKDYKLKEAVHLLREVQDKFPGVEMNERFVQLLRQRCKEVGVYDESIPAHPFAWQYDALRKSHRFAQNKRYNQQRHHFVGKQIMSW